MLVANVDTVVIELDDAAFGDCHSKDVARQAGHLEYVRKLYPKQVRGP